MGSWGKRGRGAGWILAINIATAAATKEMLAPVLVHIGIVLGARALLMHLASALVLGRLSLLMANAGGA